MFSHFKTKIMNITINSKQVLKILYVLAWIIFIGLCVQAGGFIFNTFFKMVLKPAEAKYFWQEVDLSGLYEYDHGHFFAEALVMIIVAVMKAWMFYLIIVILHDKKLNMGYPFRKEVGRFIFNITYITFVIGLFSWRGVEYTKWLAGKGVIMPAIQDMGFGGADVWLFMSATLFVIAHIFKRGIDIQTENELTV